MTSALSRTSGSGSRLQPWFNPFDRFFGNDLLGILNTDAVTIPAINITEEKDSYKIEMAVPGLKKEDFDVNVEGNLMTISCEKESETKEGKNESNYSRKEYNYSSFSRSFTLPENADPASVNAKYVDGILNLVIKKKGDGQKTSAQKIKVS
jgi:HSP20 family protein